MERIWSYPSVYNLGHKAVQGILDGIVLVEEKVDGSQFSFMVDLEGNLLMRSKGADVYAESPPKMFAPAVEVLQQIKDKLHPGWVYRAEFLGKPKHNVLVYRRAPLLGLVVYDIETAPSDFLGVSNKAAECIRIGLEQVPVFYQGTVESLDQLQDLLKTESFLGGVPVEGVVMKRYDMFTQDKKVAMAKFVSEAFKEKHAKEWKVSNPGRKDVVQLLIHELRTEARWHKAVQHLRELGMLEESPKDIGLLFKEVPADVEREEAEYIKGKLFAHFWPQISRAITAGLAEWYKTELAKQAFEPVPDDNERSVADVDRSEYPDGLMSAVASDVLRANTNTPAEILGTVIAEVAPDQGRGWIGGSGE